MIDPRPYQVALAQAQANLVRDQAQLADAKLNADRYSQLVKEGIIPQQQSDTQAAIANQLEGAVQADQAQIDSAKLNLIYSRITSPIDGRVGLRLVDQGNIVQRRIQRVAGDHADAAYRRHFHSARRCLPAVISRMREDEQVKAMTRDNGTQIATARC